MLARDFRHAAWEHLRGNWGTMALCTLILSLIMGACGAMTIFIVGGLAGILLGGAMLLGFATLTLTTVRGVAPRIEQLFDGFRNFTSALVLNILIWIFVLLWSLLLIIPGIVMSYAYSMSWFILADNPDMPATEARKRSIAMMRGNKWRLFCLDFSFIGWMLLCVLTLGILTFWIMPYVQTARAEFYQDLLAREYAARTAMNGQPPQDAAPEQDAAAEQYAAPEQDPAPAAAEQDAPAQIEAPAAEPTDGAGPEPDDKADGTDGAQ